MSEEFKIEQASRVGVIPWIDLYSESGCGKTFSALLMARGMAGPTGLIVGVDTEERRMSLYADVIPGGFKVINLGSPFHPARYRAALDAAFALNPAVVVVDSMSHEWEGVGGVCDMAMENEQSSGRAGLHNWKKPKTEHQMLVQRLLRSPCPVICCIRAKYKTKQFKGTPEMAEEGLIQRNQIGKTVILKSEETSPIQSEDFIFEATAHMEINKDHTIRLTKCNHPQLKACFPEDFKEPITIKTGEKIAAWCRSGGQAPVNTEQQPAQQAPKKERSALDNLKIELWSLTTAIHNGVKENKRFVEQWLWDEGHMSDTETLDSITESRLLEIVTKIKSK